MEQACSGGWIPVFFGSHLISPSVVSGCHGSSTEVRRFGGMGINSSASKIFPYAQDTCERYGMRRISIVPTVVAMLLAIGVSAVVMAPAAAQAGEKATPAPTKSYMEPHLSIGVFAPPPAPIGADGVRLEGSWRGPWTWKNVHSNKCMDILGASTAPEARAVQYTCVYGGVSQQWFLWLVTETTFNNSYYIGNAHSGQCLTPLSSARGAELVQTYCVNGASQDWWTPIDSYRTWRNDYTGYLIEVDRASSSNFARIVQWSGHDYTHQQWELWDV